MKRFILILLLIYQVYTQTSNCIAVDNVLFRWTFTPNDTVLISLGKWNYMNWVAVGFNFNNATIQGASMYIFDDEQLFEYYGTESGKLEFVRAVDWIYNTSDVSVLTGDIAIQFKVPIRSQRFQFLDTEQHLLIAYASGHQYTKGFIRSINFFESGKSCGECLNLWGVVRNCGSTTWKHFGQFHLVGLFIPFAYWIVLGILCLVFHRWQPLRSRGWV